MSTSWLAYAAFGALLLLPGHLVSADSYATGDALRLYYCPRESQAVSGSFEYSFRLEATGDNVEGKYLNKIMFADKSNGNALVSFSESSIIPGPYDSVGNYYGGKYGGEGATLLRVNEQWTPQSGGDALTWKVTATNSIPQGNLWWRHGGTHSRDGDVDFQAEAILLCPHDLASTVALYYCPVDTGIDGPARFDYFFRLEATGHNFYGEYLEEIIFADQHQGNVLENWANTTAPPAPYTVFDAIGTPGYHGPSLEGAVWTPQTGGETLRWSGTSKIEISNGNLKWVYFGTHSKPVGAFYVQGNAILDCSEQQEAPSNAPSQSPSSVPSQSQSPSSIPSQSPSEEPLGLELVYCPSPSPHGDGTFDYTFRIEKTLETFDDAYIQNIAFGEYGLMIQEYITPPSGPLVNFANTSVAPLNFTSFLVEIRLDIELYFGVRLEPSDERWYPNEVGDSISWTGNSIEDVPDGFLYWSFDLPNSERVYAAAIQKCTSAPSSMPSGFPSDVPSNVPSLKPSSSIMPSSVPSRSPSLAPSGSAIPSTLPSSQPSSVPSDQPSFLPSLVPSSQPSSVPSDLPSLLPSLAPSTSSAPSTPPTREPDHQDLMMKKGSYRLGMTESSVSLDLSFLANNDTDELQDLVYDEEKQELSLTKSNVTIDLSSLDKPRQELTFDVNTKMLGMTYSSVEIDLSEAFDDGHAQQSLSIANNTLKLSSSGGTTSTTTATVGSGTTAGDSSATDIVVSGDNEGTAAAVPAQDGNIANADGRTIIIGGARKLNTENSNGGNGGGGGDSGTAPEDPDPVDPVEVAADESMIDLSFLRVVHLQGHISKIDTPSDRRLSNEQQEQGTKAGNLKGRQLDLQFIPVVRPPAFNTLGSAGINLDPPVVTYGGNSATGGWPIMPDGRILRMSLAANGALTTGRVDVHVVDCTDPNNSVRLGKMRWKPAHGRINSKKFAKPIPITADMVLCAEVVRVDLTVNSEVNFNAASLVLLIEQW